MACCSCTHQFTPPEANVLIKLLEGKQHIFQKRKQNNETMKAKSQAWTEVQNTFTTLFIGVSTPTVKQLKKLWRKVKGTSIKNAVAEQLRQSNQKEINQSNQIERNQPKQKKKEQKKKNRELSTEKEKKEKKKTPKEKDKKINKQKEKKKAPKEKETKKKGNEKKRKRAKEKIKNQPKRKKRCHSVCIQTETVSFGISQRGIPQTSAQTMNLERNSFVQIPKFDSDEDEEMPMDSQVTNDRPRNIASSSSFPQWPQTSENVFNPPGFTAESTIGFNVPSSHSGRMASHNNNDVGGHDQMTSRMLEMTEIEHAQKMKNLQKEHDILAMKHQLLKKMIDF